MVKCTICVKLRAGGLSIEWVNHAYEHIYHCGWTTYTDWCPHNLGKIKKSSLN